MNQRKLSVSRGQLELGELFPDSPMLLIGRSPACDMVLRMPGLQPVHFLLEWAGEGDFDPNSGIWVLTEIGSHAAVNEAALVNSMPAKGCVLGTKPVQMGGLIWRWTEGTLSRAELAGGVLRDQVHAAAKSVSRDLLGPACLEVILLSADGQTVVDVEHLRRREVRGSQLLRREPKMRVRWEKELPTIAWGDFNPSSLNSRAAELPPLGKTLATSDLIFLQGAERSYYIRMVPRLKIRESSSEFYSDPFFKFAAIFSGAMIVLLYFLHGLSVPPAEITPPEKPRMATVEVKEARIIPPEPPEVELPLPPPPPLVEALPKSAKSKSSAKPQKLIVKQNKKAKPAAAPAAPVVTDVQAVGLLESIKKTNPANAGVVSADSMVNRDAIKDSATSAGEKILVSQASGIVDMKKAKRSNSPGKDILAEASDNVTMNDDVKVEGVSPVKSRFDGTGFSIDRIDDPGDGTVPESGFGESVKGGLSREAVGRIVMAQRQKIRACYQTGLLSSPKLSGRLVLRWKIAPSGEVISIKVVTSDLHQPSLESCVVSALRTTTYPAKPESTVVVYPFVFKKS